VHGAAVSVYRVVEGMDSGSWPTVEHWPLESGSGAETRRYIPTKRVTIPEWDIVKDWLNIIMFGPIRYGIVGVDSQGCLLPTPPEFDPLDSDS